MSSRKRRQAREWLTKTYNGFADALEIQDRIHAARISDLTKHVRAESSETQVWPQDPKNVRPFLQVHSRELVENSHTTFSERFERSLAGDVVTYTLRAVQMALPLPDGRTIRWFAWELQK